MMGIGHTLFEEMIYQDGQLLNPGLLDYRIPTMTDLPGDLRSILVENADGPGPHGSKGIGESGLMPTAPAIANAIARAIGVRLTALPLTPNASGRRCALLRHSRRPEGRRCPGTTRWPSRLMGRSGARNAGKNCVKNLSALTYRADYRSYRAQSSLISVQECLDSSHEGCGCHNSLRCFVRGNMACFTIIANVAQHEKPIQIASTLPIQLTSLHKMLVNRRNHTAVFTKFALFS